MAVLGRAHNGIGTRVYGKRDFRTDGSFITTKWITFLWVPLIPLGSMRVRPSEKNTLVPDHLWASLFLALGGLLALKWSGRDCVIQSKGRPVLLQVLYVYAFVVALGLAWWNLGTKTNLVNASLACGVLALPFILRVIGRSRADEPPHQYVQSNADYPSLSE
jgi:hypothetical protein